MIAMAESSYDTDANGEAKVSEKLVTSIRSHDDLESLRTTHALVLVKAIKTGCKHCEHLAPHFGAAAAACSAAAATRTSTEDVGKIGFAVAEDDAAVRLFNVKSYPTLLLFQGEGSGRPVLTMTRAEPLVEWRGAILARFLEEQLARVAAGADVQPPSKVTSAKVAQQARQQRGESGSDGEKESDEPGCCIRGAAETGIEVTLPSGLVDSEQEENEVGGITSKDDL